MITDPNKIPQEMRSLKQWINYHSPTDKRPIPAKYGDKSSHMDMATAFAKRSYIGFIPYKDNEIALLDIDKCKDLKHMPATFLSWARSAKPYVERSPSGNGLRIVVTVPVEYKSKVDKAYAKSRDESVFLGQIGFHTNYQTMTGHQVHPEFKNVTQMPIELIDSLFNVSAMEPLETVAPQELASIEGVPSVVDVESWMNLIPIDQGDQVKVAYKRATGNGYEHYEFWREIGMSLYDWGYHANMLSKAYEIYSMWSAKDEVAYTGDNDVHAHWVSFASERHDRITWKTIRLIASHFRLEWPICKPVKGKEPPQPTVDDYKNFDYLFTKFLGLKGIKDSMKIGEFYVTGNKEICDSYLQPYGVGKLGDLYGPVPFNSLCNAAHEICQDNQYRSFKYHQCTPHVVKWTSKTKGSTNMIKYWLDTDFINLPEQLQVNGDKQSTFEDILDCIHIQDVHVDNAPFYRLVLTKAFLGWLKMYYYKGLFGLNNLIPVLTGPENCRKSTFVQSLLPMGLSKYVSNMSYDLKSKESIRDANKMAASHAFIEWGEMDRFLGDDVSSAFKDFASTDRFTYIDKYDKHETTIQRHALIFGTTNDRNLRLSRNGTRRTPVIPVKYIDTARLVTLNLHHAYRHLRDTVYVPAIKNRGPNDPMPWLLTQKEVEALDDLNTNFRSETSTALMLQELFDFSQPFNKLKDINDLQRDSSGTVMKLTQIKGLLERAGAKRVTLAGLKRDLEDLLGRYTNTANGPQTYNGHTVAHGMTWVGEGRSRKTFWIVPPLNSQEIM